MAITTVDGLVAAGKQRVGMVRTATRTVIAAQWFSIFDLAGSPGAGTLAIGNTANGVVPTDATAGYPPINAFGGGATGYLSKVEFGSAVACRIALYDRVFACGAYAFNANTTLASQPSYSGRLPGTDYKNLEIWVEAVTASTGNLAVNVTYTDQDGNTGATTGATGIGAVTTVGRCWQLPLAAGDSGVQAITNVTGSVASAGTFNVMVLRPLWEGRVKIANDGDVHDFLKTGMPEVYADSALYVLVAADSTSSGVNELNLQISNG
jgi:hypothetical protein